MAIGFAPGTAVTVAATGSSVAGTVAMGTYNCLHIANTSATLFVAVRYGVGSQTAVLTTDLAIPPMSYVVISVPKATTGVAAIGSGAGPTVVMFTPCAEG